MAQRINFYRGIESRYIIPDATPREGADVAFYPQFINGVFFAKDTGVIYVNGKRYGFSGNFNSENPSEIVYSSPKNGDVPEISVDGKNVPLFRIYSGTPKSLKVDIDENKDYKISLDLKLSDSSFGNNAISTDGEKIGVFLGMKHKDNSIEFGSYDFEGNFNVFGSIEDTEFLKRYPLESIRMIDSSVLRMTWNDDNTKKGMNTVVDIPLWNCIEEIRNYKINGKKISENPTLDGNDILVGISDEIKEHSFSEFDNIATALKKIDVRLNTIESQNSNSEDGMVWQEYLNEEK